MSDITDGTSIATFTTAQDISTVVEKGTIELNDALAPVYERVITSSNQLIGVTKIGEMEETQELLTQMSRNIRSLQKPKWVFGFNWIPSLYYKTDVGVRRLIDSRKTIKTALEEMKIQYDTSAQLLKDGIGKVESMSYAAQGASNELGLQISFLQRDLDFLTQYEGGGIQSADINDSRQRYVSALSNAKSLQFSQNVSVQEFKVQLREREILFEKITILSTQLHVLLSQQMGQLISQQEVSKAKAEIDVGIQALRSVMVQNAEHVKNDALEIAEFMTAPLVDEPTINKVSEHIIDMITGVKCAIQKGLDESIKAGEAAERQSKTIAETAARVFDSESIQQFKLEVK